MAIYLILNSKTKILFLIGLCLPRVILNKTVNSSTIIVRHTPRFFDLKCLNNLPTQDYDLILIAFQT